MRKAVDCVSSTIGNHVRRLVSQKNKQQPVSVFTQVPAENTTATVTITTITPSEPEKS